MKKTVESKCILCNNNTAFIITDKLRYGIERNICKCCNCDLVYMNPQFLLDDSSGFYEKEYRQLYKAPPAKEFYYSQINISQQRLKKIDKYLNADMKILEIGSAAGSFLTALKQANYIDVMGVELDKDYSQFAIDKLNLKIYQDSIENLDLEPESFGAIICFHVFEHFSDPVEFAKNVLKLLKPGGRFIAEVPNVDDYLLSFIKLKSYQEFYFQPAHNFYFSPATVNKTLLKAGFGKVNIDLYQRYSIFNGLNWIKHGKPTGLSGGVNSNIVTSFLDYLFCALLFLTQRTDTLIVCAEKTHYL